MDYTVRQKNVTLQILVILLLTGACDEEFSADSQATSSHQIHAKALTISEKISDTQTWRAWAEQAYGNPNKMRYIGLYAIHEDFEKKESYRLEARSAIWDFEKKQALFQTPEIHDPQGRRLSAPEAQLDFNTNILSIKGPLLVEGADLKATAAEVSIYMNEGRIHMHGGVQGAIFPSSSLVRP